MGRLLVGISELDHFAVIVGPSEKAYARGQVVAGESRRYGDCRNKHQEGVQVRRSFLVDEWRVDPVLDKCRLVLDRLVNDSVESVVRHDG